MERRLEQRITELSATDNTAPRERFAVIARANAWDDAAKAVALASCLRGKARSVLDSLEDAETFSYTELKAKLELRFGEGVSAQNYYLQFTDRCQKAGEEFATLGADLERLSRLAYPECSAEIQNKIACSQFVAALTDGYVKRTLQLEGIVTLTVAIERAKVIKIINENSFSGKRNGNSGAEDKSVGKEGEKTEGKKFKRNGNNQQDNTAYKKEKECWQCGAKGHFRTECPAAKGGN
ncbi:hypothetical protein DMN91_002677 [Ooceraea biroi]|uniref:CCHC-type domain-containing protein n=1 Tax=Ooceraea biroi TaxID=2015173 RepID=A0A3L8DXS2_OOCBI|nr:hypothetical protein DMN91_002677 [Ooceraea biroi]